MPSLTDDLEGRSSYAPSLLDDIVKTAGSTIATFGAHAVKGLTLGLLDPTQEVGKFLGEEVYGAAPEWAKTGAEITGSVAPVSGALRLARHVVPGVGAVPRILQGFVAGAGLGGLEEAIAGGSLEDVFKGSLLEGMVFGGIEGLAGIPAMVRKRRMKGLQRFWGATRTMEEAKTIAPRTTPEELAERSGGLAMQGETSLERAINYANKTPELPQGIQLASEFWDNPDLLLYFKLMEEPVTIQTLDRLIPGKVHSWDKSRVTIDLGNGVFEHFNFRDFRPKKGVQKLRMFRGHPERNSFPRNRPLELNQARADVHKMKSFLFRTGTMAKSDLDRLQKFVNPRVRRLSELSEHELHTYSDYLTKLTKGEQLPEHITDQIKIYGPAHTDVRLGILATWRPARWMFESLNKKIPWMMDRFFNPTIKAVEKRNLNQLNLMDHTRELAKGLSRKQLRKIYEIDKFLADRIKVPARTSQYINISTSMMDQQYKKLAAEVGPKTANKLREAHEGFRDMFDKMFDDLVNAGRLEGKRYIKQYWPLLRDQSIVARMFGKKGQSIIPQSALPREVKGFMQFMRKNIIDNPETDILKLSKAYISVYTKLMHLAPVVDDMHKIFKDFRVKKDVRDLMKHYLARQLGVTSEVDYRIAATIKGIGGRLPWVGEKFAKNFTTQDWMRMGVFLNNLPYYAHLGMRPFAAARNLLQPWLTTGPMIGNRWLVRGYQRMLTRQGRSYIKEIGGLQESLGEYTRRLHIKPKFRDNFANWMMGMFRKSDEMNRFAAGLGMAEKFDHFFAKMGMTENFFTKIKLRRFRDSVRARVRDWSKVYRAFDDLERYGYPKGSPAYQKAQSIIDEFSHGREFRSAKDVHKEMKDTIVKEAIGDTQWLYGKDQSPLFGYRAGFIGRQALTYQTWWLNYFEFLKNLGRTTRAGDYAPLATAFANNMLLMMALTGAGWELTKVGRTIAFGPFSGKTVVEGEIPPGVDPFIKALGGIRAALTGDIEGAEKRLETAMKRAWDNWIPGSLVYKELARIDVAPQLSLWGKQLTPYPTQRYATPEEKVASVFGRRQ
jgi:hypothetical protein